MVVQLPSLHIHNTYVINDCLLKLAAKTRQLHTLYRREALRTESG